MPIWKRTMDYLGLGPDDTYDDYDDYDEPEAPPRQRGAREPDPRGQRQLGREAEFTVDAVAPRPSIPIT